jgi:UPF0755 protein
LAVLGLAVAVVAGAYLWAETAVEAQGPNATGEEVAFVVPKKSSAREVGRLLAKQELISDPQLWRFHLWARGGLKIQAGRFPLRKGMSLAQVARVLEGSPLPEDQPFVIIEGWRLRDTDAALTEKGLIRKGEYLAAASSGKGYTAPFPLPEHSLEGFLYPETYRVPKDKLDPRVLVQRQLDMFVERVYRPHEPELGSSPRQLAALVTMASMLEREEPDPTERPLVAGILWKRVDKGFPLGVDATSRYELAEWNDRDAFLVNLRNPKDGYNTRLRTGLPPTPIGSPTEVSFKAALHPKLSEFLYYLHDAQRHLHPSRNAQEHEKLRAKYGIY